MSANDKARITAYQFDPNEITIIGGLNMPEGGVEGVDNDATDGPGYDARILKPLSERFVQSIIDEGILQPVILRKNGKNGKLVVDGRNRVRGARVASKRVGRPIMVPCLYHDGTDHDFLKKQVVANEYRDEDFFANKAKKAADLRKYGSSDEEIAASMNCTVANVKNYFKYFELDASVQEAMKKGFLTGSAAIKLVDLPREEQAQALEELLEEAKKNGSGKVKMKAAAATAKGRSSGQPAVVRPGIRVMGKVIAHEKAEELPEGFVLGIRWAMGDMPPEKIKGLKSILNELFITTED